MSKNTKFLEISKVVYFFESLECEESDNQCLHLHRCLHISISKWLPVKSLLAIILSAIDIMI